MGKTVLLAAAVWLAVARAGAADESSSLATGVTNREEASPEEAPRPAEEAPKPAPKPNPTYIEGRGFDFRTSDGLFDFAIGANLQVRFSNIDFDDLCADADDFRIRLVKLYMTVFSFDPRLTYRFQLAFENVNNVRMLDDAWVAWKFEELIQVQAGQSKTPFSREELMNDGVLMFA